jgi:hypothetical protein
MRYTKTGVVGKIGWVASRKSLFFPLKRQEKLFEIKILKTLPNGKNV